MRYMRGLRRRNPFNLIDPSQLVALRNPRFRRNLIDPSQLVALRNPRFRRNTWKAEAAKQSRLSRLEEMKDALNYADPTKVDVNAWAEIYDLVPRDILNAAETLGIEIGAHGIKDPCWPETCSPYNGAEKRRNPYISMYRKNPAFYRSNGFRRNPDPDGKPWGPKLYNPLSDRDHEFKDESHYQRIISKLRRKNPFRGFRRI